MDEIKAAEDNKIDTEKQTTTTALTVNTEGLKAESLSIINQIIAETDEKKTQDLTYLFNINQNKKTLVRINKLNELQDALTDQAVARVTQCPDELSNKDLMDGLKIVQDLIERGQSQVKGTNDQPLIQFNQQNTSVNLGNDTKHTLNRTSREKVKNAVLSILNGIDTTEKEESTVKDSSNSDVIDVEPVDFTEPLLNEEDDNDR